MGRQAVLAIVETRIAGLNYIDAGTTFPLGGKLKIFVDGTESAIGSALINAISNISPTNTRITEINILAQTPMDFAGVDPYTFFAHSNLTIWIDWANGNVQWQGRWLNGPESQLDNSATTQPGYSTYQGSQAISAAGNTTITLLPRSSLTWQRGPDLTLETGPNREILKLPIFAYASAAQRPTTNSYTITTDDGVTVTAAPTPSVPVDGVKISALSAVETLQDDDLFVLSQDDPSGGTYDASYNVTLNNLKANIDGAAGWSSGWSAAAGNNTITPYSHTLNSTDVVWQIYVAENDEGLNAIALDVQLDLQGSQNDTLGALLSDVTTTSFNLQLGGGYLATLKLPQATISFSAPVKFVKVVGRRS
jgi:hypothetical protein